MVFPMIVVPKLGGHKDILALDKTFINCPLDSLSCLLFVLIVVCAIEESIAHFDGLATSVLAESLRNPHEEDTYIVNSVSSCFRWDFPKTESYERHLLARGQLNSVGRHDVRSSMDHAKLNRIEGKVKENNSRNLYAI